MNPKSCYVSPMPSLGFVFSIAISIAIIISSGAFVNVVESSYSSASTSYEHHLMRSLSLFKASRLNNNNHPPISPGYGTYDSFSHLQEALSASGSRVYHVVAYGADPSGESDSTEALEKAISDAFRYPTDAHLMQGVTDLGGSQLHLDGGTYKISRPLRLPDHVSAGNFMIHGGSLRASESFPGDRHLIELWPSSPSKSVMYEDITLKDLMLNSNFRGGGVAVINSVRTTIENCYISHFTTQGILIQGGHETYVRNSFIGQHINIGGDEGEKEFTGIGVKIMGNDNALTDVVIFSAKIGVMVLGQANVLNGVHCYNKATGLGGTGVYVGAPGLTQTRIVNSYFDYTGVVVEDPVQFHITGSFFLGNGFVEIKSVGGVVSGVNIVDNMFTGDYTGVEIVKLDESKGRFKEIDQVVVDRNNVRGMVVKTTVGRGSVWGNGTRWTVDLSKLLLFPNRIQNVEYALALELELELEKNNKNSMSFPNHVLRSVSQNRVTVETDAAVAATLHVSVHQTAS